jgi:hypothetical protein
MLLDAGSAYVVHVGTRSGLYAMHCNCAANQRHREGVTAGEVQLATVLPKEIRADSGVPNRIGAHMNIASSAYSLGWYRCAVQNGTVPVCVRILPGRGVPP